MSEPSAPVRQTHISGQIYGSVTRIASGAILLHVKLGAERQIRCQILGASEALREQLRQKPKGTITAVGKISARYGPDQFGKPSPELVLSTHESLIDWEETPSGGPAYLRGAIQIHAKGVLLSPLVEGSHTMVLSDGDRVPLHLRLDCQRWVTQRLTESGGAGVLRALASPNRELAAAVSITQPLSGANGGPITLAGSIEWMNLQA